MIGMCLICFQKYSLSINSPFSFRCWSLFFSIFGLKFVHVKGSQPEREEKVSLELSEEILQSMEAGMVFRDYVIFKFPA